MHRSAGLTAVIALSKVALLVYVLVCRAEQRDAFELGYHKLAQIAPSSRLHRVAASFTPAEAESMWAGFAPLDAALQGEALQRDTFGQGPPTAYLNNQNPAGFEDEQDFVASWPA